MYWNLMLILYIVALLGCAMGFKYYIWFLSAGYGGAVAVLGLAQIVMSLAGVLPVYPLSIIQDLLFIGYGLRLCIYTMKRDLKNKDYVKVVRGEFSSSIPIFVSFFIWIYCGALYCAETSTAFYRLANRSGGSVLQAVGLVISVLAVVCESTADKQKTEQKKIDVNKPAMQGLYKMCRCPNYFGEIMFWTGHFIGALDILKGGQWIVAVLGEILIVYIMFNGAQRLEKRQDKRYGDMPEYQEYIKKTPIIIPFLPIYHLYDPAKEAAKEAAKAAKAAAKEKKEEK